MIKFPFTSMQQFNLDWIMQQLKKILDFMPLNGVPGDVLQRNVDGAAWMPISAVSMDIHGLNSISGLDAADEFPVYDNDQAGNYKVTLSDIMLEAPVQSVNGQTGDVVISTGGLVDSVNGQTGTVVLGKSDVGLGNVANELQYSSSNPPPYPVTSVNGQTGAVIVSGGGAVDSVNGQTGTVVLGKSDVGLGNVANELQYSSSNPPPYPVTSVNGQTGAVTVSSSGYPAFGTDVSLSVSSNPSDITVYSYNLYGAVSADGKNVRIYGNISTSCPTDNTGWGDLVLSGITVTAPASAKAIYNIGIGFHSPTGVDPNEHIMTDIYGNTRLRVLTDGSIRIGLYYPTILGSDVYYFSIFPFILNLE